MKRTAMTLLLLVLLTAVHDAARASVQTAHEVYSRNAEANELFLKAREDRGNWMNQLKVDPVMDPLRSDPRFQKLMRLMKFKA